MLLDKQIAGNAPKAGLHSVKEGHGRVFNAPEPWILDISQGFAHWAYGTAPEVLRRIENVVQVRIHA